MAKNNLEVRILELEDEREDLYRIISSLLDELEGNPVYFKASYRLRVLRKALLDAGVRQA